MICEKWSAFNMERIDEAKRNDKEIQQNKRFHSMRDATKEDKPRGSSPVPWAETGRDIPKIIRTDRMDFQRNNLTLRSVRSGIMAKKKAG